MSTFGTLAADRGLLRAAATSPQSHQRAHSPLPFVRRIFAALAAGRTARAERFVQPYLARLSEADLRALGHTPPDIARIKQARNAWPACWL
ncbi:MAG: hypothetical protein NW217_04390 [Hyphomicrobiaceae bacterium]|nr:hypothetical protein [Hyphomicrobiaceae bacterium]